MTKKDPDSPMIDIIALSLTGVDFHLSSPFLPIFNCVFQGLHFCFYPRFPHNNAPFHTAYNSEISNFRKKGFIIFFSMPLLLLMVQLIFTIKTNHS